MKNLQKEETLLNIDKWLEYKKKGITIIEDGNI